MISKKSVELRAKENMLGPHIHGSIEWRCHEVSCAMAAVRF
jgi:hypothetical protein